MTNYYAIGTNTKGTKFRLYDAQIFTDRLAARIEAERLCKVQGLTLDGIYITGQSKAKGVTLTKFNSFRIKNNIQSPDFSKAL